MKYLLHPDAALEHEEHISYYEERRAGLGRRYHLAMLRAIDRASRAPRRFKIVRSPNLRKVSCWDFHMQSSIVNLIRCCRCSRSRITVARLTTGFGGRNMFIL